VNELLLEEDKGDPWGTMEAPPPAERLSSYTTDVRIRRAENVSEVTILGQYKGDDPGVKVLSWRQSVVLYKGCDRIDFRTEIDWDTYRRRLRIALPTGLNTDEAVYSIPYGALKRGKYEPEMTVEFGTNGDWPAVNWIDVFDQSRDYGVALLNAGTPSHKVDGGVILLSVLRSPADLWSVTEEDYDHCLDFDGVRDSGSHEFRYSLLPHQGDHASAEIEKRGREFNNPLICRGLIGHKKGKLGRTHSFLTLDATRNVIITAIKKADRDDSIIVRLAETDGTPGEASVSIEGAGLHASLVNFLERHPERVSGPVPFAPFRIATVRLEGQ
jgi:alpha-mannosidase